MWTLGASTAGVDTWAIFQRVRMKVTVTVGLGSTRDARDTTTERCALDAEAAAASSGRNVLADQVQNTCSVDESGNMVFTHLDL
jgi:hypothetical protein